MSIQESLQTVLANTYLLYLKTQNYHWNVSNTINFKTLHELFEKHYEELADAVDAIAERIRQLGSHVPATFADFSKHAKLKEGQAQKSAAQMLADLAADQDIMLQMLDKACKEADAANDEVTVDLLINRMSAHAKAKWFYTSSLE